MPLHTALHEGAHAVQRELTGEGPSGRRGSYGEWARDTYVFNRHDCRSHGEGFCATVRDAYVTYGGKSRDQIDELYDSWNVTTREG